MIWKHLGLIAIGIHWGAVSILGQEQRSPALPSLSETQIEQKIELLRETGGASADTLVGLYQTLLGNVRDQGRHEALAVDWQQQLEAAKKEKVEWQSQFEINQSKEESAPIPESVELIQKEINEAHTSAGNYSLKIEELLASSERIRERKVVLDERILQLSHLADSNDQSTIPSDQNGEEALLVSRIRQTESAKRKAERVALQSEKTFLDFLPERNNAGRVYFTSQLQLTQAREGELRDAISKLKTQQANRAKSEAEISLSESDTPTQRIWAQENIDLASRRTGPNGINNRLVTANARSAGRMARLQEIKSNIDATRSRVTLLESADVSIDPQTGYLLRNHRRSLPSPASLTEDLKNRIVESTQANLELIEILDDQRAFLLKLPELRGRDSSPEGKELLMNRVHLYEGIIAEYRSYLGAMDEEVDTIRTTKLAVEDYRSFVDQRLLWIRSSPPLHEEDWENLQSSPVGSLGASAGSIGKILHHDSREHRILWLLIIGLFVSSILIYLRFKKLCPSLAAEAEKRSCTSFWPTLAAIGIALLAAIPWGILLIAAGWRLGENYFPSGRGFLYAGWFVIVLVFLLVASGNHALFISHLGVTRRSTGILRGRLRWVLVFVFPVALFAALASVEIPHGVLYRSLWIALLLLLTVFSWRIFHPKSGIFSEWKSLRYPIALLGFVPASLAVAVWFGYQHSVELIVLRLAVTLFIIFVAWLLSALIQRAAIVSRRQIAISEALERRRLALLERERSGGAERPEERSVEEVRMDAARLVELQEQTRKLIWLVAVIAAGVAVWGAWAETIPSLGFLDTISLWEAQSSASGVNQVSLLPSADQSESEGNSISSAVPISPERVSLQDLLAAIGMTICSFVLAAKIPALLDILILKRLQLRPGGAYATTTVLRYIIIATGVSIALALIEIEWSKIQWIAAAITLGIGFGLQEIFANFVAGIIILIERPIRLGDFVTLGDINGQVFRIKMRATTIRDFGSRELIVPNREFITGQLINWTLSDPLIRVEIPIGIAYGSDTIKAKAILEKVGRENRLSLEEPAPQAVFLGFGDSALNFELRVHIHGSDDFIRTKSELHFAIDEAFREEGIEIPFPQRDIHIKGTTLSKDVIAEDLESDAL